MYNYIEYLPLYLREVQEFLALGEASDPAAREAYDYTVQQYLNQSVMTADERTISRWEAILRMSGAGLSLDTRRQRILIRFCLSPPFTRKRLKEILETLTGVPVKITEYFDRYCMRVEFFEDSVSRSIDYPFLWSEIYEIKPANITMELAACAPETGAEIGIGGTVTGDWASWALPELELDYGLQKELALDACMVATIHQEVLPELEAEEET